VYISAAWAPPGGGLAAAALVGAALVAAAFVAGFEQPLSAIRAALLMRRKFLIFAGSSANRARGAPETMDPERRGENQV
jgi:hypothetical protein